MVPRFWILAMNSVIKNDYGHKGSDRMSLRASKEKLHVSTGTGLLQVQKNLERPASERETRPEIRGTRKLRKKRLPEPSGSGCGLQAGTSASVGNDQIQIPSLNSDILDHSPEKSQATLNSKDHNPKTRKA